MSIELSEWEIAQLNEGRVMRIEADVLMPIIKHRITIAVSKIIAIFKSGEQEKLLAAAAELSTLEDIRSSIDNKIKRAEVLERRIHNDKP